MKKKASDPLEHRKPDFDIEFSDFKQQLADLEVSTSQSCLLLFQDWNEEAWVLVKSRLLLIIQLAAL